MDTTEWKHHLTRLLEQVGREPAQNEGLEPWVLWEWRRVSIPEWRRILEQSIDDVDPFRERYARWMLGDILLDPEYEEPQS